MKWVCLLAFDGVGLGALGAGLVWGAKRWNLQKNGVPAKGTVVELSESVSTERVNGQTRSSVSHYPLVAFTPASSRTSRSSGWGRWPSRSSACSSSRGARASRTW